MVKVLTIVVPSYNTEKYVDECLPTMLDDRINEKLEILMVNDGSKDNTLDKLREYEVKVPGTIKVIDKENGGHGSTINKGIEHATGKYIRIIDGDDWVNTEELVRFVQGLENTDVDLVLSPYEEHIFPEKTKRTVEFNLEVNKEYSYDEMILKNNYQIPMMHGTTFKVEVLRKYNLKISENSFYVDLQFIVFPMEYVQTVTYINTFVYCYRLGTQDQSVNINSYFRNRDMHRNVVISVIEAYNRIEKTLGTVSRVEALKQRIFYEVIKDVNLCLLNEDLDSLIKEFNTFKENVRRVNNHFWDNNDNIKIKLLNTDNRIMFFVLAKYIKFKLSV